MFIASRISALLVFALLLVGCGSLTTQSQPPDWKDIDATRAAIRLDDSLGLGDGRHQQAVKRGLWSAERAVWNPNAKGETAFLHYVVISPSNNRFFTDANVGSIASEVESAWEIPLSLGESGKARNTLGEYEYQQFVAEDRRHCVYVRQYISSSAAAAYDLFSSGRPLGKSFVRGHYCQNAGPIDAPTRTRFLKSYSVDKRFKSL